MGFSVDIEKFAEKCHKAIPLAIQKIVIAAGDSLVDKTPVGDPSYWKRPAPPGYMGGHAKGNWHYSLGAPHEVEFDVIDPDGSISKARIRRELAGNAGAITTTSSYVQNNVPYIRKLEYGHHSPQCPPNGMAGRTMVEIVSLVRQVMHGV